MEDQDKNPIDPNKVAANPGLLTFPHTVGSALVKPEDMGKVKGRALSAMEQQTEMQLSQLYQQMKTLVDQANAIKKRVEASEDIYKAKMGFEPIIGHTYFLYEKTEGELVVSMLSPEEWGRSSSYHFLHKIRLLADHTWEVLDVPRV